MSEKIVNERTLTINGVRYPIRFPERYAIDHVVNEIFVQQVYPFLPLLNSEPGVIVDIGANIGCATIFFRARYPTVPILAFEPDPESFSFLNSNTASLNDIRTFNFGLYNRDTRTKLFQGTETSATNSIGISSHNSMTFHEIELRRISSVIAELSIDRIRLLKIDTEGAEVPLIRDLEGFLDRIAAICVEYHSEADRLEIDHLLSNQFILCASNASFPMIHRGTVAYISKALIASRSDLNKYAIIRPSL